MKRRSFISGAMAASAALAAASTGFAQNGPETATPRAEGDLMTDMVPISGYAPVNGLEMYYEIHGVGEPLLLMHGAYGTIDLWGPVLETLAQNHQVIAIEPQGHGHTADIDRPIRYETMTDDAAALLKHLDVEQADVVGFSMGGGVALQLAMRYPELVRKVAPMSVSYNTDGVYPEVWAGIEQITPEMFAGSIFEEAYLRNAPNPEDWPVLVEKLVDLDRQPYSLPEEEIRAIEAPMLFVIGDSDIVTPEHAVALFRLVGGGVPGDLTGLPRSQLAIIPGTTHIAMMMDSAKFWLPMVEAFLAAPVPEGA